MRLWNRPLFWVIMFMVCVFGSLLGMNMYKYVRYSKFTATLQGSYEIVSSVNNSTASHNSYAALHTAWWGGTPSYEVTRQGQTVVGDFIAQPTLDGELVITEPPRSGRLGYATITMENLNGATVAAMYPDRWYRISQGDSDIVIKFHWGT